MKTILTKGILCVKTRHFIILSDTFAKLAIYAEGGTFLSIQIGLVRPYSFVLNVMSLIITRNLISPSYLPTHTLLLARIRSFYLSRQIENNVKNVSSKNKEIKCLKLCQGFTPVYFVNKFFRITILRWL
jgi:hypothetical protein